MKTFRLAASLMFILLAFTSPARAAEMTFRHHFVDRELPGSSWGQTAVADLDRDGRPDFITGRSRGEILWYRLESPDRWVRHRLGEQSPSDVGGAAYDRHGHPLPEATLKLAKEADAVLFGAVGDWKYDKLERALRPEQAILGLRRHLGLFANFRPALCYEQLTHASSLKPELVAGLDILIIRELTGDIYFGQPRGRRTAVDGHFPGAEEAFDTMRYSRPEIERIAHVAFQAPRNRRVAVPPQPVHRRPRQLQSL